MLFFGFGFPKIRKGSVKTEFSRFPGRIIFVGRGVRPATCRRGSARRRPAAKRSRKISAGVSPRAMRTFVETKVAPQTATEKSAARWYRYDPDFNMAAQKYVFFRKPDPPGRPEEQKMSFPGCRALPGAAPGGFRSVCPAASGSFVRRLSGCQSGAFREPHPAASGESARVRRPVRRIISPRRAFSAAETVRINSFFLSLRAIVRND